MYYTGGIFWLTSLPLVVGSGDTPTLHMLGQTHHLAPIRRRYVFNTPTVHAPLDKHTTKVNIAFLDGFFTNV